MIVAVLVGLAVPLAIPAGAERPAGREVEAPVIGPAEGDELHVMSFNLRFAADEEPNSWASRRPAMAELLRREQPTVVGTQEGLYHQLTDLDRALPGHYAWIGEGRAGGSHDEFMAVLYDTRRLEPLEYDHFWLSDTPSLVGSTSWGNRLPRMVTWVRFADRRTGAELVVVNTHLDDRSAYARERAAALLRERIAAFPPDLPVVLTGDFNAPAGHSPCYDVLTERMTDTWTEAARRGPAYATWHGYRPLRRDGERIDWILSRGAVTVHAAAVNTFHRDGQFPSDHLPVQALVSLG
ncbi:MAG TPA: endonuclease/exonuclease/phosphatase family protein [Actinophytocola sp.]|nr:endonuclease/exonuclease/phosphatase family protein [Actinophytocola sp.]